MLMVTEKSPQILRSPFGLTIGTQVVRPTRGVLRDFVDHTAVSTKVVQKTVKANATMSKGSLGNTQ